MQNKHWCMCEKLKAVARDGQSTCSICGGKDAYGLSTERPDDKMVELKINTKYRVMGLPENVGRIENGDIVETTDIVQNLPFVGVVGITHPESAWIKKTFLFDIDCGKIAKKLLENA